jgi:hypothetical protein
MPVLWKKVYTAIFEHYVSEFTVSTNTMINNTIEGA